MEKANKVSGNSPKQVSQSRAARSKPASHASKEERPTRRKATAAGSVPSKARKALDSKAPKSGRADEVSKASAHVLLTAGPGTSASIVNVPSFGSAASGALGTFVDNATKAFNAVFDKDVPHPKQLIPQKGGVRASGAGSNGAEAEETKDLQANESGGAGSQEALPGTAFKVGRDNDEQAIQSLRNWTEYEKRIEKMQRNIFTHKGYLDEGQDLVDTLVDDSRSVRSLGYTNEQLANWVKAIVDDRGVPNESGLPRPGMSFQKTRRIVYNNQPLKVTHLQSVDVDSPPLPHIDKSSTEVTIINLDNRAKIIANEMSPDFIRGYGFYPEGVAPEDIVKVFTGS